MLSVQSKVMVYCCNVCRYVCNVQLDAPLHLRCTMLAGTMAKSLCSTNMNVHISMGRGGKRSKCGSEEIGTRSAMLIRGRPQGVLGSCDFSMAGARPQAAEKLFGSDGAASCDSIMHCSNLMQLQDTASDHSFTEDLSCDNFCVLSCICLASVMSAKLRQS